MLESVALRYDPAEDRVLVCIRATGEQRGDEHWLHLTRRVCAAWRADLQAMIDLSAQPPRQLRPEAKAAVSAAHHQAMAGQAPLRTRPAADGSPPSSAVALVTSVACGRRRDDGRWVLRFELRERGSLSLVLDDRTLHGLAAALSKHVHAAGWALPALPSETGRTSAPSAASAMH